MLKVFWIPYNSQCDNNDYNKKNNWYLLKIPLEAANYNNNKKFVVYKFPMKLGIDTNKLFFLRFMRGIEQQFLALQKGFTELIPPASLRPFDERELELVISGIGKGLS